MHQVKQRSFIFHSHSCHLPEVITIWLNGEKNACLVQRCLCQWDGPCCQQNEATSLPRSTLVLAGSSPHLQESVLVTHSFPSLWQLPAAWPASRMQHIMENNSYLLWLLTGLLAFALERKTSQGHFKIILISNPVLICCLADPPTWNGTQQLRYRQDVE